MPKKPSKEKQIRDIIDKWRSVLELEHWEFNIKISDKPATGDRPESTTTAHINPLPEYQDAAITVFPIFFNELSKEEQEQSIVHELCHCLVKEMDLLVQRPWSDRIVTQMELNNANERLTSWIARIAMRSK